MLKKTTFREIKATIGRYLAILSIIALGVAVFTGLKMCKASMIETASDYYQEQNLYDYEILTSYGIDEKSVKQAKAWPGVRDAEDSIQQDIIVERPDLKDEDAYTVVYKAISLPERINKIKLEKGRLPEKDNECVVDSFNVDEAPYKIGETIKISQSNTKNNRSMFKKKKYKVVGIVSSPLFLDYDRGTSDIGDGTLTSFFYIKKSAFDTDYSTQIYIDLDDNYTMLSEGQKNNWKDQEKSMKTLAKKINRSRKNTALKEAQEELDKYKAEYNSSLSKYNSGTKLVGEAYKEAKNYFSQGKSALSQFKKQYQDTIKSNQNSITEYNNQLSELQSQLEAGTITEEDYTNQAASISSAIASANTAITQAQQQLQQVEQYEAYVPQVKDEINNTHNQANNYLNSSKAQLAEAKKELDDAQEEIDDMKTGKSYAFSANDNSSYSTFEDNADIVSNIAKIFPIFFLLVAALVCMTTMTRMVDEQRTQIGIMRGLGFKKASIRTKYLFYSGSASLIGAIIGLGVGSKVFPAVIWNAYSMMYNFDDTINYVFDYKLGGLTVAVAVACALITTGISCSAAFKEVVASLLKPKAPPAGRRILLERIGILWNRMNFMQKVSLRNVFRYKKRLFMMVLGICGCTALLIAGFGIKTSISGITYNQYENVDTYDYAVYFDKNMEAKDQKAYTKFAKKTVENYGEMTFIQQENAKIKIKDTRKDFLLTTTTADNIKGYCNLAYDGKTVAFPGDGEILLCRKAEKHYGARIGDEVSVKIGSYEMTATISGFYDNYIEDTAVMSEKTYIAGTKKPIRMKTALVKAPENATEEVIRQAATDLANNDDVMYSYVMQDTIDMVDSMMVALNSVIIVIIICAGLLSFVVLYNLTNINIIERIREIATIKVLGFFNSETAQYVFRENILITFIAGLVGLPVGRWLLDYIMNSIKIEGMFFITRTSTWTYPLAFAITLAFTLLVNNMMRPKLKKISMTESLKTIE